MGINNFPEENIREILNYLPQVKALHAAPQAQASDLLVAFDRLGFTKPGFDYHSWLSTYPQGFVTDQAALASADFETVRNLITAHMRIDRFVGGHLDSLFAQGYFKDVLVRIQTLHTA